MRTIPSAKPINRRAECARCGQTNFRPNGVPQNT